MASCRVIFVTSPLAAAYGASSSVPTKPKIDEKLMIEPPPFSRESGTACLVQKNTPFTSIANT